MDKLIRITCDADSGAPPEAFEPFQNQAKYLTKDGYKKLARSIARHGFAMPVLVWKGHGMKILDGHQRVATIKQMLEEGFILEGGQLPYVEVEAADEREATEKVLAFISQHGKIDDEKLYELIETRGVDFFEIKEEIELPNFNLEVFEQGYYQDEIIEDEVPPVPEKARTKLGDLYELGRHRLLCGDSTKAEDVARVMGGKKVDMVFTDPPYGINYDPQKMFMHGSDHSAPRASRGMANDDGSLDLSFLWLLPKRLVWGFPYLYDPSATGWLVWDKHPGLNGESIGNPVEIASTTLWSGFKIVRCLWGGYYRAAGEERGVHPTQKPLGVVAPYLEGASVFDPFLGSGTTLIAAEQLNRVCYGIEIDALYCDVIVTRWCKFTGEKKIKLNGTGIEWKC